MLHEIDEVRIYCGPAALIAVTGKRYPVIRAAINKARARRENCAVTSTYVTELLKALNYLGWKHYCMTVDFPSHVSTLEKMVNNKYFCLPDRKYIIHITGHYVAVENGVVFDNGTRFGSPVGEHWCRNKKVKSLIWVHK
jgi:hypothetical protein